MHSPLSTDLNGKAGLALSELPDLPIFCSAILRDDDPRCVAWVDFWDVCSTGDKAADAQAGERYADIAISYARKINLPTFVYYVAFAIEIKLLYGIIERGPMEIAFLEQIGRTGRRALQ